MIRKVTLEGKPSRIESSVPGGHVAVRTKGQGAETLVVATISSLLTKD